MKEIHDDLFLLAEAYGCNECGRHIYHKRWVQPPGCERTACGKTGFLRNHQTRRERANVRCRTTHSHKRTPTALQSAVRPMLFRYLRFFSWKENCPTKPGSLFGPG